MNYQKLINELVPCERIYVGTHFSTYIMDDVFKLSNSNTITIKASKSAMVRIVDKIFPYVYLNLLKTEIIEDNIVDDGIDYYFLYDNCKLIYVAKIH